MLCEPGISTSPGDTVSPFSNGDNPPGVLYLRAALETSNPSHCSLCFSLFPLKRSQSSRAALAQPLVCECEFPVRCSSEPPGGHRSVPVTHRSYSIPAGPPGSPGRVYPALNAEISALSSSGRDEQGEISPGASLLCWDHFGTVPIVTGTIHAPKEHKGTAGAFQE